MNNIKRNSRASEQNRGTSNNRNGEKTSISLKCVFLLSVIVLIVVILLRGCSNVYYTSTTSYEKIAADENQEAITKDTPDNSQPAEVPDIDFDNHEFDNTVTLYSRGNVATATNNKVSVDVYNIEDSSANMVLEIYIDDDELISKIGTNGRTSASQKKVDAQVKASENYVPAVCVAKSGLIFPGNKITVLNLLNLEDGTVLPAGEYNAYYKESFYDDNGNLHSVNASLAITLVVQ